MERSLRQSKRQGRAPKSRTSNACEACKRRKTKCSGGPSPCDVCKRAETFCNFNPKLDTRRKLAYNSTTIQDRQQFMLTALFQTIKHCREDELNQLMCLIRGPSRPDAVAACLQKHFTILQDKGVIPMYDSDDTDVISFGLQGLCGHRKGPARPKPESTYDERAKPGESPAVMSMDSAASDYNIDEEYFHGNDDEDQLSRSFGIDTEQKFDRIADFDPATMLDHLSPNLPQQVFYSPDGDGCSIQIPRTKIENRSTDPAPTSSKGTKRSRTSDSSRSRSQSSSNATRVSSLTDNSGPFPIRPATTHTHISPRVYPNIAPEADPYMMHYYQTMGNGFPTTVSPHLDMKYGQPTTFFTTGNYITTQDEFGRSQFAFGPLRSNA